MINQKSRSEKMKVAEARGLTWAEAAAAAEIVAEAMAEVKDLKEQIAELEAKDDKSKIT